MELNLNSLLLQRIDKLSLYRHGPKNIFKGFMTDKVYLWVETIATMIDQYLKNGH